MNTEDNTLPHKKNGDNNVPVVRTKRFYIGLGLIITSFVIYFCLPLLFLLPYNVKTIGTIVAVSYGISWGIFTIAIAIMGKDGYMVIKDYVKKYYLRLKGLFFKKGA